MKCDECGGENDCWCGRCHMCDPMPEDDDEPDEEDDDE
jgi:predicted ATP-dependent serine protease